MRKLLIALLCLAPAAAATERLPEPARAALAAADWPKLAELLAPAAGKDDAPENVRYWYGVALERQGQYGPAIPHLDAALRANPRDVTAARLLARAARETLDAGALDAALAAFPADGEILTDACRFHLRMCKRKHRGGDDSDKNESIAHKRRSLAFGRRAVAAAPDSADARIALARTLYWGNRTGEAARQLAYADRLAPLGYEAYDLLARCYMEIGAYDEAAAAYAAERELNPVKAHEVDWPRGMALWKAGRHAEAVEVFRSVFESNHPHLKVRYQLGRAAYDAGDYALALYCLRESYRLDRNLDALAWAARCAYDMGQDQLARTLADEAIAAKKDDKKGAPAMWHFVRGRALWQLGEKKAAAADLEKAVEKEPGNREYVEWAVYAYRELDDPLPILHVTKLFGRAGHPREAVAMIKAVQKRWPKPNLRDERARRYGGAAPELALTTMAEMYDQLGMPKLAWALYRRNIGPFSIPVNSWASWLAVRGGDLVSANLLFTQLTRRGSDWGKQRGYYGLAYLSLCKDDAAGARAAAGKITHERFRPMLPTVEHWAGVIAKEDGAGEKLDPVDLLGFCGVWHGWTGLQIDGLLPGSPLLSTTPPLRARDVLITVDGYQLHNAACVANLRKRPIPEEPVVVVVRRGDDIFEVSVDLAAAKEGAAR
jgi:tetratricopeptide (TPR) repeat protein